MKTYTINGKQYKRARVTVPANGDICCGCAFRASSNSEDCGLNAADNRSGVTCVKLPILSLSVFAKHYIFTEVKNERS